MKTPMKCILAVLALCAALGAAPPAAQAAGLLTPTDGRTPALQIRDHKVTVVVEEAYAATTVEQVFANPHDRDLEAVYSFPVPERAAVSAFTYWIDGKPVTGEVLAKEKARRVYADEKAAGREAALAEQDSHKTFDITVWPVRARDTVRVRLTYLQPTGLDTGIGRYAYPLEEGGVDEAKLAFWTADDKVTGDFSFDLTLRSSRPVEALRLPDHPAARITQDPGGDWQVHLGRPAPATTGAAPAADDGETRVAAAGPASLAPEVRLDRDVIVYWRLKQGLSGSVDLVAHRAEGAERGTFMLTITPDDDLAPITRGRDWSFVLDVSGSMAGKFATLAEGVSRGLRRMRPDDRFRIVLFNDSARLLDGGFRAATAENVDAAIRALGGVTAERGTDLYAGLNMGLDGLDADRVSAVLLVTDGVANLGETRKRAFLDLARRKDVRLFTFVMGNSANRPLLDALTRESGGTAFAISNSDDIVGAVLGATDKVGHESLRDLKLVISGVRTADVTPARLGSLYRGQRLVVFGHYWGGGTAEVTVSGMISGRAKTYTTGFPFPATAADHPEVERLWAYAAIEALMHEAETFGADADVTQAATDLAVENGLVTPHTSMVVVRDARFAELGIERRNRDRVATEDAARQRRLASPAALPRADTARPMFTGTRATHHTGGGGGGGGTGAIDPFGLGLMVLFGAAAGGAAWRRRWGGER